MEQDEILNFNKMCVEFLKGMKYIKTHPDSDYNIYPSLKYVYQVDTSEIKLPIPKELNKKINSFQICDINLSYQLDLNKLKFHSDWNLIMEVVEAIEKLDFTKTGYSWKEGKRTFFNNEGTSVEIENNQCLIYENLTLDPPFVYVRTKSSTKKEAVVQAINEFLIWYEKNYTK